MGLGAGWQQALPLKLSLQATFDYDIMKNCLSKASKVGARKGTERD